MQYGGEIISEELKYAPSVQNHSTYAFRKVSPQGVSTAIALSTSSSVGPTEFIIPPSVFNPAKSRLNFQLQIKNTSGTAYNWLDANLLSTIGRVVLYDSNTNAVWLDCSNFEKYAALIAPAGNSYNDFKTKSLATATALSTSSATSQLNPVEDIQKSNSTANDSGRNVDLGPFNNYEGRRALIVSGVGAADRFYYLDVSLPLSAFKLTALSLNKNLYNPANLVLQIYWNAMDNFCWVGDAAADPSSGVAVVEGGFINNVALQIATEQNLSIISKIQQQVMSSGISIPIAYPTTTRQALANSSAHSYQLNITKGYGQRILALVSAPFAVTAGATAPGRNVLNSHTRSVLSSYNTFMNNIATKYQGGYNCLLSEDYYYGNREYFEKSTIQSIGEYVNNEWVHIDSYFGERPLHEVDQTEIDGYDVGATASAWQVQANLSTSSNAIWVTAIIGQKMLTMSSQGSMVA